MNNVVNNIVEMKQQARALREQKNYQEAIKVYSVLWEEHRDDCDEWDSWGYAQCLRKAGRSQEALDVCRQAYPLNPDFEYLRNLYAWCVYDLEMKQDNSQIEQNEGRFLKAANAILDLTKPEQYSPYARTVFRVIDYYKKRASYPSATILEWLNKLQPEQLSTEVGHGPDEKGKTVEYASDKEKWYATRCKALFELGGFEECISFGQQALTEFTRFHHDSDVWFRWRIAISEAELGDKETAIAELKSMSSRKKDWFIYHRIAQYLFELGRVDEALGYAIDAALGPGDLEYKWELFLLLGTIFKAQERLDEAQKHTLLAAKLRQQQDWKIPAALSEAIQDLSVDVGGDETAQNLHRELKKYWESLKLADMPQGQGKIKNMLSHGKAGFIYGDDGKDYYFKTNSFKGPRHLLERGQRVSFYIERNPDPSKRDNAVYVRPLESA